MRYLVAAAILLAVGSVAHVVNRRHRRHTATPVAVRRTDLVVSVSPSVASLLGPEFSSCSFRPEHDDDAVAPVVFGPGAAADSPEVGP